MVAEGCAHVTAASCDTAVDGSTPAQHMVPAPYLPGSLAVPQASACHVTWGCTLGPQAPPHLADVVAAGPSCSAPGVGPGLCPGVTEHWPLDQQNPKPGPSNTCEKAEPPLLRWEASAQTPGPLNEAGSSLTQQVTPVPHPERPGEVK